MAVGATVGAGVGEAVGAGVGAGVATGALEALGAWMVTDSITTGWSASLLGEPLLGIAAIWSATSIPETTSPKMT